MRFKKEDYLVECFSWLGIILMIAFILVLTTSCGRTLAERCADRFPASPDTITRERVQLVTDTLMIPDTYVEFVDTTICPPDLPAPLAMIDTVVRRLPGRTIERVVTVPVTDTVIKFVDAPLVAELGDRIKILDAKNEELKETRGRLRWWLIGLGGFMLLIFGVALFKKVSKLKSIS